MALKPPTGNMIDCVLYAATYGRMSNQFNGSTTKAVIGRGYVVGQGDTTPDTWSRTTTQITPAGWSFLSAVLTTTVVETAHSDALIENERFDRIAQANEERRQRTLNAPADATFYGHRSSDAARTEEEVALTSRTFGPWVGLLSARQGIIGAIDAEIADFRRPGQENDFCVDRLQAIRDRFVNEPETISVAVDSLRFYLTTNDLGPVSSETDTTGATNQRIDGVERPSAFQQARNADMEMRNAPATPRAVGELPEDAFDGIPNAGPLSLAQASDVAAETTESASELWDQLTDWAAARDRVHPLSTYSEASADGNLGRSLEWRHILPSGVSFRPGDASDLDVIILASYGDYCGSPVDAANYRYLSTVDGGQWLDGSSDVDPLLYTVGYSERDGLALAVMVGDVNWSAHGLDRLLSIISYADDNGGCMDDETLWAYEADLKSQWWSGVGRNDIPSQIAEIAGVSEIEHLVLLPATKEKIKAGQSLSDLMRDAVSYVIELSEVGTDWTSNGATEMYPFPFGTEQIMETAFVLFDMSARYDECPVCTEVRHVLDNDTMSRHTRLDYYSNPSPVHCHGSGRNPLS